jgi:CAAX prenyl protease-like protein
MSTVLDPLRKSPVIARVAPYVVFLILTAAQGWFGESGRYWFYLIKTVVGAWMIWELRGVILEMRWSWSWEAAVAGVLVFGIWVGLDPFYPGQDALWHKLGMGEDPSKDPPDHWNPLAHYGAASVLGWTFVMVRILGSSWVVPPLEEVFFRSFLYRYLISPEFERVPLNRWHPVSLAITVTAFGFIHQQWLAGILCGLIYQGLVLRKNRIGDAMTAHAITNFLLGCWVVWRGDWQFW